MKKYVVFGGMLVEVKDDKFMGYPIEGIACFPVGVSCNHYSRSHHSRAGHRADRRSV